MKVRKGLRGSDARWIPTVVGRGTGGQFSWRVADLFLAFPRITGKGPAICIWRDSTTGNGDRGCEGE